MIRTKLMVNWKTLDETHLRAWVNGNVQINDADARGDLINPLTTRLDLIKLLATIIAAGWHVRLTAINTDHGSDPPGAIHGHKEGFAVDLWPCDRLGSYLNSTDPAFAAFLQHCATHNPFVVKIGLGGITQGLINSFGHGSTIVFLDNSLDHVHLQTV